MHSLPFTEVLAFVTCQNMSKHLGIGSAEQSRRDVKTIKNWKRVNLGGESLEKWAILSTSTQLEVAQLLRNSDSSKKTPNYDVFGDDDLKEVPFHFQFFIYLLIISSYLTYSLKTGE